MPSAAGQGKQMLSQLPQIGLRPAEAGLGVNGGGDVPKEPDVPHSAQAVAQLGEIGDAPHVPALPVEISRQGIQKRVQPALYLFPDRKDLIEGPDRQLHLDAQLQKLGLHHMLSKKDAIFFSGTRLKRLSVWAKSPA